MPELTQQQLDSRFDLLKKVLDLFHLERIVHLTTSAFAFLLLVIIAIIMIKNGLFSHLEDSKVELTLLFGSSGLFGYTGGNILRMYNQALKIIVEGKI